MKVVCAVNQGLQPTINTYLKRFEQGRLNIINRNNYILSDISRLSRNFQIFCTTAIDLSYFAGELSTSVGTQGNHRAPYNAWKGYDIVKNELIYSFG